MSGPGDDGLPVLDLADGAGWAASAPPQRAAPATRTSEPSAEKSPSTEK